MKIYKTCVLIGQLGDILAGSLAQSVNLQGFHCKRDILTGSAIAVDLTVQMKMKQLTVTLLYHTVT